MNNMERMTCWERKGEGKRRRVRAETTLTTSHSLVQHHSESSAKPNTENTATRHSTDSELYSSSINRHVYHVDWELLVPAKGS